jgi:hypothetical protein
LTSVRFDNRPANRQPHAEARFLRGNEWLEYLLRIREPHTVILNVNHDVVPLAPGTDP